jgi:hypothetical protein
MNPDQILTTTTDVGLRVALQVLGAFVVFIVAGPQFAVRPYCHNDHYWQVYFDANRAVAAAFGEAGFAAPATVIATRAS